MADRWIVTGHRYMQHKTLEAATREQARLAEKLGKEFRVYRVKDTLTAGETAEKIALLSVEVERLRAVLRDNGLWHPLGDLEP